MGPPPRESIFESSVERGVEGIEIFGVQVIQYQPQAFAKPLIVDDFPRPQKADGILYIGIIHQTEDIVIGGTGFLFSSHIFMKIGDGVTLGLEGGGRKRRPGCCLGPNSHSMVHKIRSKALFLDLLRGLIPGKLSDNGTDHLHVSQFFGSDIGQETGYPAVAHGVPLGQVAQRRTSLSIRSTKYF